MTSFDERVSPAQPDTGNPLGFQHVDVEQSPDSGEVKRGIVEPPSEESVKMSDDDSEQLKRLQAKKAEQERIDSRPTEENFTHYMHLADGRIVRSRGGAGTVYSEGAGTQDEPEVFTRIVGIFER